MTSTKNSIFSINFFNTDDLGLKIVFAKDKITNKSFAVVIEVNPFGLGCKKNIEIGDILYSINKQFISDVAILKELSESKLKEPKVFSMEVEKKAAFNISGLFYACLGTPCSDACKLLNVSKPEVKSRKGSLPEPVTQIKKSYAVNSEVPSKLFYIPEPPKVKYHQKAIPMKKKETGQRLYRTTIKSKKSVQSHVVVPAQPTYKNRKENPVIKQSPRPSLKESKSLTDLTNLSNNNSPKNRSSSLSSTSSDESVNSQFDVFQRKQQCNTIRPKKMSVPSLNSFENSKRMSRSSEFLMHDLEEELQRRSDFQKSLYSDIRPYTLRNNNT